MKLSFVILSFMQLLRNAVAPDSLMLKYVRETMNKMRWEANVSEIRWGYDSLDDEVDQFLFAWCNLRGKTPTVPDGMMIDTVGDTDLTAEQVAEKVFSKHMQNACDYYKYEGHGATYDACNLGADFEAAANFRRFMLQEKIQVAACNIYLCGPQNYFACKFHPFDQNPKLPLITDTQFFYACAHNRDCWGSCDPKMDYACNGADIVNGTLKYTYQTEEASNRHDSSAPSVIKQRSYFCHSVTITVIVSCLFYGE